LGKIHYPKDKTEFDVFSQAGLYLEISREKTLRWKN
jgi:hypothetical protein